MSYDYDPEESEMWEILDRINREPYKLHMPIDNDVLTVLDFWFRHSPFAEDDEFPITRELAEKMFGRTVSMDEIESLLNRLMGSIYFTFEDGTEIGQRLLTGISSVKRNNEVIAFLQTDDVKKAFIMESGILDMRFSQT